MSIHKDLYNIYTNWGATDKQARLIIAQNMLESDNFNSPLFKKDMNIGGVIYIGQKGATKGSFQPAADGGKPYAKFTNLVDSALSVWNTVAIPLKYSSDSLTYANNLKNRPDKYPGYYGNAKTPEGIRKEIASYKANLDIRLQQLDKILGSNPIAKPEKKK